MDEMEGPRSPEKDEMLINLAIYACFGDEWATIAGLISARTGNVIENYWNSTLNWKRQEVRGVSGHQPPSISDTATENMFSRGTHSYSRDQSAPSCKALNKQDSSQMMIDGYNVFGSQNPIHNGNSRHEVGGMVGGQAPCISDMASTNVSQPYSDEQSAPSRDALNKRDSLPMMIDSDNMEESVGSMKVNDSQEKDIVWSPEETILQAHGPFTPEEDETILQAHTLCGDKWADIARLLSDRTGGFLSDRTGDEIKNSWNSTLKWKSSSMTNEDTTIELIAWGGSLGKGQLASKDA
ncbi:transcription factor MYB44-like protein [Tanacetum coccineum]